VSPFRTGVDPVVGAQTVCDTDEDHRVNRRSAKMLRLLQGDSDPVLLIDHPKSRCCIGQPACIGETCCTRCARRLGCRHLRESIPSTQRGTCCASRSQGLACRHG
jgi:hypothetical protein